MAEKKNTEKEHVYRSMREFEERFFPKSLEERLFETETDPAKHRYRAGKRISEKDRIAVDLTLDIR